MRTTILLLVLAAGGAAHAAHALNPYEWIGKQIFFDERLSIERDQSCAACHTESVGWTGADARVNLGGGVYEGSIDGRFGDRKPTTSAYATFAPVLSYQDGEWIGGNFWDGRATGWRLGNPAADQAQGPFLNPVEQALPAAAEVVRRVCNAPYGLFFRILFGWSACRNVELGFDDIALVVAAFEGSREMSAFSSRYDAWLAGNGWLTSKEQKGLALFRGKGRCASCHLVDNRLFTDFKFDNIGTPRNVHNPFYESPDNPLGRAWVDPGLGGFLERLAADDSWRDLPYVPDGIPDALLAEAAANFGKQRVPALRNVDKRPSPHYPKAYTHNAYFKTLKGLVHFYNTRDVLPQCPDDFPEWLARLFDCWPAPETTENLNTAEVGDLGLTDAEEDAIVAFLETLSDR